MNLTQSEIEIIGTALAARPWGEVNAIMQKLESAHRSVKALPLKKDGTPRKRPGRKPKLQPLAS